MLRRVVEQCSAEFDCARVFGVYVADWDVDVDVCLLGKFTSWPLRRDVIGAALERDGHTLVGR
jgi:hypothetical protein